MTSDRPILLETRFHRFQGHKKSHVYFFERSSRILVSTDSKLCYSRCEPNLYRLLKFSKKFNKQSEKAHLHGWVDQLNFSSI